MSLKFHSASAVEISLKRFVIFGVRVNLTRIALLMPLVDFGLGILPHVHGACKFIAAPFLIRQLLLKFYVRSGWEFYLCVDLFFASRANFIVIKFIAKAQNFKILPPLAFGAEHK